MKILLYALAGLVALILAGVIVLFLLGLREESKHVRASVVVARPPGEVWTWLEEPDKLKAWVSWLIEVRPLTDGPRGVGSKAVWVMEDANNGGRKMEITSEVTGYEPGRRLAVKLSVPQAFRGQAAYTFTPTADGHTRVEIDSTYDFDLWFAQLMRPLVVRAASRKMTDDLARLRTHVEGAPAAAATAADAALSGAGAR